VFEARFEQIVEKEKEKGRSQAEAKKRAHHPSFYADSFFVPEEARWTFLRDEVHKNVGDGLNKALAALEHENTSLEGVLGHIDFTRKVGQSTLPDKKLLRCARSKSHDPVVHRACPRMASDPR